MKTTRMKTVLPVALFLLISSIIIAQPIIAAQITYSFSDKDWLGGASWGTMTIDSFDADTLQVRYDAAPSSVIPSGSQVTGFGFAFIPSTIIPVSITNPSNSAFTGDRNDLRFITLNNLNAIPNPSNGDEFSPAITKFDFFYGATEGNANNFNPPGIYPGQYDVFYLNFTAVTDFTKLTDLAQFIDMTGIRIQSLPSDINGGSIFLAGNPPDAPVPEPGTLMLLGSGLVGLAGLGRKTFRK